MSESPTQQSGPPPKFWDALPQIIGKLTNEYLLVTLGILILVVAIGAFAPGVVESLGRGFFYLLVVLAWLAYLIVRALDLWVKLRGSDEPAPAPAPDATPPQPAASQPQVQPAPPAKAGPPPAPLSELQRLFQALNARFDREELRTLCFELGVDFDSLPGEGRSAKARELVAYMNRRGELARLRSAIQAKRPGALDRD